MEDIIRKHFSAYPKLRAMDLVNLVYEAAGGTAMATDEYDLMMDIELQGNGLTAKELSSDYYEDIGGGFCRMNLSVLRVIPVEVLGKMVIASSSLPNPELYQNGIKTLARLCDAGEIPFSAQKIAKLGAEGAHAHSQEYIEEYSQSYRVVRKEFCTYLDIFVQISRLLSVKGEVTVAIDGQSGAGKSDLARLIGSVFSSNIFCTKMFMNKAVFDYISFQKVVCENLNSGKAFTYCSPLDNSRILVPPRRVNIVEGTFSMHPSLNKYYELKIFLKVSPFLQSKRILKNLGEESFVYYTEEQIPRENAYIQNQQIELRSDLVFTAN